jgi:hypothetical protein
MTATAKRYRPNDVVSNRQPVNHRAVIEASG